MKNLLKAAYFVLFVCALLAGAVLNIAGAKAQSAPKWTGCHVGGTAGMAITKTDLPVYGASIEGLGGDGVTAGVNGGCDLQIDRFLIGAFAQYTWSDAEFKLALGGASFTAGLDEAWAVGGRAGVLIAPSTLAYGLGGYTEAKTSSNLVTLPDAKGYVFGGGLETMISNNVSVKLEYQYAKFDSFNIGPVTIEPVNHTIMLGASYRFGGVPELPK
jgi:outer membrane immunogenic protein